MMILFFLVTSLSFAAFTKDGYIYTVRKEQVERVIDMAIDGDNEGLQRYVSQLEEYGQGGVMVAGKEVYIVSQSWGLIEIRPRGVEQTFWTITEAIEED